MAEIQFNNINNGITVSEDIKVSGDVCVHIECDESINILIEQKTVGNRFAKTATMNNVVNAMEVDIAGKVFPKTIRITCSNVKKLPIGYYTEGQ